MQQMIWNDSYGLTKAVKDGRKTMTRQVLEVQVDYFTNCVLGKPVQSLNGTFIGVCDGNTITVKPRYQVGEIVAVAESYVNNINGDRVFYKLNPEDVKELVERGYEAEMRTNASRFWKSKKRMPESLCLSYVKILSVRVERLQNISDEDCLKEGVRLWTSEQANYKIPQGVPCGYDDGRTWDNHSTPQEAFISVVDGFGERDMWRHNEFVWVYEHELT